MGMKSRSLWSGAGWLCGGMGRTGYSPKENVNNIDIYHLAWDSNTKEWTRVWQMQDPALEEYERANQISGNRV